MNPYIQHSRDVSLKNVDSCAGVSPGAPLDPALNYACHMAIRMEKARAEVVGTRSALTATIFPLVGIVGYNSARGINAATNAALVAGGFAGYSAVTTLAQPDRIRVYDSGLKSLYCGIGVFETGTASAMPEDARRMGLRNEALKVDERIAHFRATPTGGIPLIAAQLDHFESSVQGVKQWLEASRPDRAFSKQLMAFSRTTVAKVNSQLTLTVPDDRQMVGDALSALQAGIGTSGVGHGGPPPPIDSKNIVNVELKAIADAVDALLEHYDALAGDVGTNAAPLNFTDCNYTDVNDVGVKDPITRFMFGPGDAYSGASVKVVRSGEFEATLSGGVPPYTAAVTVLKGDDDVKAVVTGAQLKISVPAADAKKARPIPPASYRVIVNDATNRYSKWLQVEVPETQ